MAIPPIPCIWDDDTGVFVPVDGFVAFCRQTFGDGEIVRLVRHEDRSARSHNHYFACLAEGHANLPWDQAVRFPSPEHLRAHLLIRAGYANLREIICSTQAEARRWAAELAVIDPYGLTEVRGRVLRRWTAKSQSVAAMGRKDFQASKDAVLQLLSDMIGVDQSTLSANAGMAA
jgi:hypothetical protein